MERTMKAAMVHGFGEPLLDKQLPERIKLCKQSGIGRVKIFTNGDLLRGDLARRLIESGVDEIKISIDGSDGSEFNLLRVGLNYDKVLTNVQEFRKLRDSWGKKPTIVAATCQTSNREHTEKMLEGVVDRREDARSFIRVIPGERAREYAAELLLRGFQFASVHRSQLARDAEHIVGELPRRRILLLGRFAELGDDRSAV